ncbi:unnamed protein product [Urochloa humidicola]
MPETEENMPRLALTDGRESLEENKVTEKETVEVVKEAKKRKAMAPRSEAWHSFTKIKENGSDVVKEARCNYCKITIKCDSKTNGTSSLGKHLKICKKNPNKIDDDKQPVLQASASQDGSKSSLTAWRFDPEMLKDAFTEMIITDELPFAFAEKQGFRKFMSKACPKFGVPSRRTSTRYVVVAYNTEKEKLKRFFKKSCERVCLTTDTWTYSQQQSYMCVTAHFIDEQWQLQKRIIGFFIVKGHKADDIGKNIERCLVDWGLEKVFTITVDNASPNNGAITYIAKVSNKAKTSILEGKLLHMRCAAHIVNLIVQDGLKELDTSVMRVRAAVKFIKSSPSRIGRSKKCAELEKVNTKAFLFLDVVTRWNSTYKMLVAAVAYEKVFERYADDDPYYAHDLNGEKQPGVPDSDDWANAAKMADFLKNFHKLTLHVSVTLCPTAHIFFHEVAELNILLRSWCGNSDTLRKEMAKRMIAKYNKYWGDHTSFNILVFVAVALDPRYKLGNYTKIATLEMFGEVKGELVWAEMNKTLTELFEEYGKKYGTSDKEIQSEEAKKDKEMETKGGLMRSLIAKRMKMNNCGVTSSKSELQKYLGEETEEHSSKFDILG